MPLNEKTLFLPLSAIEIPNLTLGFTPFCLFLGAGAPDVANGKTWNKGKSSAYRLLGP